MGPQGLDPLFYEYANMAIGTLTAFVFFIFWHYLAIEIWHRRFVVGEWMRGGALLRHQMAIAIATMCLGESMLRWWTWWARMSANTGNDALWMRSAFWPWVPRLAVVVEVWGLLCAIKVFAPDAWGPHWRIWAFCLTILAGEFLAVWVMAHGGNSADLLLWLQMVL